MRDFHLLKGRQIIAGLALYAAFFFALTLCKG